MPHNEWDNNDTIEHHSKVKLNILESYIKGYFRALCNNNREVFKLTYVDAFAGGGKYKDEILGSPLRAILAIEDVQEEINRGRTKPIKFDIKYIFIDNDKQAIETLGKSIKDLYLDKYNIEFICDEFKNQVAHIISSISNHTRDANRAIVFLDPYGYKYVHLDILKKLSAIGGCEVIYNLMTDHILHYVTYKNDNFINSMREIGFEENKMNRLRDDILKQSEIEGKDKNIILRHSICEHFHQGSNFKLASDFSIKQVSSNKFNALLHLSHHRKSRDVMLGSHWDNASHSITGEHDGTGYTFLYNTDKQQAFNFSESSRKIMHEQGVKIIRDEVNKKGALSTDDLQDFMAQRSSAFTKNDIQKSIKLDDGLIGLNKNGRETKSIDQIKTVKRSNQTRFYFPENKKKR